jgi:2-C-methyl-D-erythritol 4-phosphate cytidylyltransferase
MRCLNTFHDPADFFIRKEKILPALQDYSPEPQFITLFRTVQDLLPAEAVAFAVSVIPPETAVITVVPAIETIVSIENGEIQTITDRSKCYHAKAPQCFFLGELLAAHRKALRENLTNMIDSASLMKYYGHSLHTVTGNYDNIKITTPTDFYTSRALYEVRENQQIFGL